MSLSDYFNDLGNKKINTHKEALKYDAVRYTSFLDSYPKDSIIPACTLSEFGFHFDKISKKIHCIECAFQYENLHADSLSEILSSHFRFNKLCEQAKLCLEKSVLQSEHKRVISREVSVESVESIEMSTGFNPINSLQDPLSPTGTSSLSKKMRQQKKLSVSLSSPNQSLQQRQQQTLKTQFQSEENRRASFDGMKMLFDAKALAANGFYKVNADGVASSANQSGSLLLGLKSGGSATSDELEDSLTHIEQLARSVPALTHIKCIFCAYECLIFRNSLQNTLYKSPFDEHKEKSFYKCSIFANNKNSDWTSGSNMSVSREILANHEKYAKYASKNDELSWLQALFDFEENIGDLSFSKKKVIDMLVKNEICVQEVLVIKQLPKIINQLIAINNYEDQTVNNDATASNETVLKYAPYVLKESKNDSTSDFNRLQQVLHNSDNVISDKAYHPAYTLLQTRLDSFKEWPATLSQQPADLAKAGFYYFGIKDMVKCFFCNGGLKNWDHNDDPFQDHVRWFPKCQFIRQLMGADYVEKIREKYKSMDSGFTNEVGSSSNTNQFKDALPHTSASSSQNRNSTANQTARSKRAVSPRTLNSRLDSNIVRKITDANIVTRESIKLSFEKKLMSSPTTSSHNSGSNLTRSNSTVTTTNVYGEDFKTSFEMAHMSYNFDKIKQDTIEMYKSISDLLVCFMPDKIFPGCVSEIFQIKFGIYPKNVKILKEEGQLENCLFAFVSLKIDDHHLIDTIVLDLNKKPFPGFSINSNPLLVFKTNWLEIEEKVKPLLGKPTTVSSSSEHQNQPQTTLQNQLSLASIGTDTNVPQTSSSVLNENLNLEEPHSSNSNNNIQEDKENLKEENERLKNERLCVICLTKDKNVLFLPCAHLASCLECSLSLKACPICRSKIQASVRTFT